MDLNLKNTLIVVIGSIIVSLYFFPFEFTFLPKGLNTKLMLAVVGVLVFVFQSVRKSRILINEDFLGGIVIACVFSFLCYISVEYNYTDDYAYATYILSFAIWSLGAYAAYNGLKLFHHEVSFRILMHYLILVSVLQCLLSLAIEWIPQFKFFVNLYVAQDTIAPTDFLERVNRLYGIGAALDVAGTRFSIVLLGLSALIVENVRMKGSTAWNIIYLIALFIIIGVGNMISRTTLVGGGLAAVYIIYGTGFLHFELSKRTLNFGLILLTIAVVVITIATYFYNSNQEFRDLLRYGFEGFFNWLEKGRWYTDSTEKLNNTMWIWPTDTKSWIIGTGLFDNVVYGTDIGYCKFILYCGLLGMVVFSIFFIYNALVSMHKFPGYKLFFGFLLLLGFIIWVKVATDIFLIYALLYCIDGDKERKLI